jgi:hypothetical protein
MTNVIGWINGISKRRAAPCERGGVAADHCDRKTLQVRAWLPALAEFKKFGFSCDFCSAALTDTESFRMFGFPILEGAAG